MQPKGFLGFTAPSSTSSPAAAASAAAFAFFALFLRSFVTCRVCFSQAYKKHFEDTSTSLFNGFLHDFQVFARCGALGEER